MVGKISMENTDEDDSLSFKRDREGGAVFERHSSSVCSILA